MRAYAYEAALLGWMAWHECDLGRNPEPYAAAYRELERKAFCAWLAAHDWEAGPCRTFVFDIEWSALLKAAMRAQGLVGVSGHRD